MFINKHVLPKAGTPLPSNIKKKAEDQSGISLADIRVNYQSKEPAYFNAHAITYGKNIYLCPGKSNYLEHEVGHAIQQKVTQVSSTGFENGLPVNENTSVEQKAVPENYIGYQARSSFRPVVQKAKVSVTLSVLNDNLFNASDVNVDTINLPNRFNTSLTHKAQGDHTIADVLFKRGQKHAVMGGNIAFALYYYKENADGLLTFANRDPYTNQETKKLCAAALTSIEQIDNIGLSLEYWNVALKQIIQYYNEAWALSTFSTTSSNEGKSGGRNEGKAMKDLADGKHDYSTLYRLLDMSSVDRIQNVDYATTYEGCEGYDKIKANYYDGINNKQNEILAILTYFNELSEKANQNTLTEREANYYVTLIPKIPKMNEDYQKYGEYKKNMMSENTTRSFLIDKTIELINSELDNKSIVERRLNLKKEFQGSRHIYGLIALFKQDCHIITKIRSIFLAYLESNEIGFVTVSEGLGTASQRISSKLAQEHDKIIRNGNSQEGESGMLEKTVSNLFNYYIKKLENGKDNHREFIEKYRTSVPHDEIDEMEKICTEANSCIDVFIKRFQQMLVANFADYDTSELLTDDSLERMIDCLHIEHIKVLEVQDMVNISD